MTTYYDYPTNFSNGLEVNGTWDFFIKYPASQFMPGWFGMAIVVLIWSVTFGLSMASGSRKATLIASFVSFIFAIFLFMRGMISPFIPFLLIVLTIIGAIGSKQEGTL